MAGNVSLPSPNVPLVDLKSGMIGTDWYRGLLSLLKASPPQTSSLWTPTDASGASLVLTLTHRRYVQIGAFVYVTGTLTYPATADGSNAKIGGLPATTLNEPGIGGTFLVYYGTSPGIIGVPDVNANSFSLYTLAGVQVVNSALSTAQLRFQFFYPAA